jgi:hypothetical protein
VHKRTGAVTYKVGTAPKTFKTLRGLERYANHLRDVFAEEIEELNTNTKQKHKTRFGGFFCVQSLHKSHS